ncbi:MAG: AAA family ATPase, partial [Planctomycetes bacterium]|nr:AAA family ATPase [Planctomycetota bacterium]
LAEWMHDGIEGQAALAVEGGLGRSNAPAAPEALAELGDRVHGRLRDAVRCADAFSAVADALCNDVLLVADVETAAQVVRVAAGWRAVTPEGELVDAVGIVGGSRTLAQGAIGRRSSAAEKREELARLEQDAARVEADLARLRGEREELRGEQAAAQRALEAARQALVNARSSSVTAEARVKDLRVALDNLEHESAGVIEERRRMQEQAERARATLAEVETDFARENAALNQLTERRRHVEEERDARIREEGEARVEETRVEQLLAAANRRIEDLERIIQEGTAELERARRLSTESADSARAGSEESEELARHSAEVLGERARVEEQVRELREHAARETQALDELRRRRDVVTRQLEAAGADLSDRRLEEQRIALSREEVLRRADEELGLECEGLLEGFEPEDELRADANLKALDRAVREMKSQLDRMGPVNMEALGELDEVSGRLEFLETQIADLQKAKRTLHETIKRIEEESERLFLRTFQEVRGNFQRIFRQLFGGGKADVVLAEGEPILEAGVEISARPPGREMLPIGLLSGGQRTMTALALLFAVFEARPSPFCILDEVDAALDDANIQRFLAMLEGFRKDTQFVVVTHNKGTMGACDSLYGVTMQTKGVSRHVAVQLADVDEFVPEATGNASNASPALLPEPDTSSYNRRAPLEDDDPEFLEHLDEEVVAAVEAEEEIAQVLDEESGEPVVELYPAHVEPGGAVQGGDAQRPRESATRAELDDEDDDEVESATGIPLESSAREKQVD